MCLFIFTADTLFREIDIKAVLTSDNNNPWGIRTVVSSTPTVRPAGTRTPAPPAPGLGLEEAGPRAPYQAGRVHRAGGRVSRHLVLGGASVRGKWDAANPLHRMEMDNPQYRDMPDSPVQGHRHPKQMSALKGNKPSCATRTNRTPHPEPRSVDTYLHWEHLLRWHGGDRVLAGERPGRRALHPPRLATGHPAGSAFALRDS
ncbi:hypothetical protein J1605_005543 [Eschrichtius robustus]|uniref:Uncharacterized protein n=1 Tax=Eschrichtius robustus TaxID=9764 RepID=A0AB34HAB7_ESCRO|nr:hypothetical protein J1605_005543 [Eschrichtius robustus]